MMTKSKSCNSFVIFCICLSALAVPTTQMVCRCNTGELYTAIMKHFRDQEAKIALAAEQGKCKEAETNILKPWVEALEPFTGFKLRMVLDSITRTGWNTMHDVPFNRTRIDAYCKRSQLLHHIYKFYEMAFKCHTTNTPFNGIYPLTGECDTGVLKNTSSFYKEVMEPAAKSGNLTIHEYCKSVNLRGFTMGPNYYQRWWPYKHWYSFIRPVATLLGKFDVVQTCVLKPFADPNHYDPQLKCKDPPYMAYGYYEQFRRTRVCKGKDDGEPCNINCFGEQTRRDEGSLGTAIDRKM